MAYPIVQGARFGDGDRNTVSWDGAQPSAKHDGHYRNNGRHGHPPGQGAVAGLR